MTDVEQRLWRYLRRRQVAGFKFRRQCHIGPYIVDFVCFEARLVIEVDGGQHARQAQQDAERSEWLSKQGFQVLRFWNHEVLQESENVLQLIFQHVQAACPALAFERAANEKRAHKEAGRKRR